MNRFLIGILLVVLLGKSQIYHRLLFFSRNGDFTWKFLKEEYKCNVGILKFNVPCFKQLMKGGVNV